MIIFRLLLILLTINILIYTGITGLNHGWNLVPIFFNDIAAMAWPGQFNTDFMSFLILSMSWTMWRNKFSPLGIGLGVVALFGGIMFLAPYLLFLSFQTRGDMRAVMLGAHDAQG